MTRTLGAGSSRATVSASMLSSTGAAVPSRAAVLVAWLAAPPASTMSTHVVHLPAPASLKVIVTLLGRAAGGIGRRDTSTAQLPSSGDAPEGGSATAGPDITPATSRTTKIAFIRCHRRTGWTAK